MGFGGFSCLFEEDYFEYGMEYFGDGFGCIIDSFISGFVQEGQTGLKVWLKMEILAWKRVISGLDSSYYNLLIPFFFHGVDI